MTVEPMTNWQGDSDLVAAVDLGSNSFHLLIARIRGNDLHTVDRVRETLRFAAGLDSHSRIRKKTGETALACLHRFGQRLAGFDSARVRAVGTNTLRKARNSAAFLAKAEAALGHPIEIISGREEARLIYLGVASTLAQTDARRLVVDIGGGSTELVIGEGAKPRHMESLYMGCVSMTEGYFPGGKLTRKRFHAAKLAALQELEPVGRSFCEYGWMEAVGSSGTVRSIEAVIRAAGWSDSGITRTALDKLVDVVIEQASLDSLELPGLSPERIPVFPGGVAILSAVFDALSIEHLFVATGALREGLLRDLVGRISHRDIREHTVEVLVDRYRVDTRQAQRVAWTALVIFDAVAAAWELEGNALRLTLTWAAKLHEIGLSVAHSQYHKHGAYILHHADMAGFSWHEQAQLAVLVRLHRRKFSRGVLAEFNPRWRLRLARLAIILRLAVLLNRARTQLDDMPVTITTDENKITVKFTEGWLHSHPLTAADLEQETEYLRTVNFTLEAF